MKHGDIAFTHSQLSSSPWVRWGVQLSPAQEAAFAPPRSCCSAAGEEVALCKTPDPNLIRGFWDCDGLCRAPGARAHDKSVM